jgi:5-methylcytosine-specific restriction enzyme A
MPTRSKRPCKYPGCPHLEEQDGYCATHQDQAKAKETYPERHGLYGPAWRRRRMAYLASHVWCEDCLELEPKIYTVASDVHHVIPHRGDRAIFYSSPLRALCHAHHSKRTTNETARDGGQKCF